MVSLKERVINKNHNRPLQYGKATIRTVQAMFRNIDKSDDNTRANLYNAIAKLWSIVELCEDSSEMYKLICTKYTQIVNSPVGKNNIEYVVAVVGRNASTVASKSKASKIGRVIKVLRKRKSFDEEEVLEFLQKEGIEGALKSESSSKKLTQRQTLESSAVSPPETFEKAAYISNLISYVSKKDLKTLQRSVKDFTCKISIDNTNETTYVFARLFNIKPE